MKKLFFAFLVLFLYPHLSSAQNESLPYREEEVKFQNGDITLAGTMTLPLTKGPHPAMIMITGSGQQNRDEEIFGFKPFRIIADYLSRRGIAVLRYDDRGVGGSSKGSDSVTTADFAEDAYAGLKFLQKRKDIDPKKIGLFGHSEGGIVAPIVASKYSDVSFIILMAGTAVNGEKILLAQLELILRADSTKDSVIQKAKQQQKRVFEVVKTNEKWDELEDELVKEKIEELKALPKEKLKGIIDIEKYAKGVIKLNLKMAKSYWFKFFIEFDPKNALEKVTCPVLALFGELDLQVPAEMNKIPMEEIFKKSGNKDYTIKVFSKANHLFQSANTGGITEYGKLKKEFVPGFLETISDWLTKRVVSVR